MSSFPYQCLWAKGTTSARACSDPLRKRGGVTCAPSTAQGEGVSGRRRYRERIQGGTFTLGGSRARQRLPAPVGDGVAQGLVHFAADQQGVQQHREFAGDGDLGDALVDL